MPSNNAKYTSEFRERTCQHIKESGKSASSVAKELGIGKGTVCKWVKEYEQKHNLPSYVETKGIKKQATSEQRETQRQSKLDKKRIQELEEENEILKKALRIFTQAHK